MEYRCAARDCSTHIGRAADVPLDALDLERLKASGVRAGFNERGDLPTVAEQRPYDGRSDESRRSGNQRTALGLHHHRMR
jgi:hypothetical protein